MEDVRVWPDGSNIEHDMMDKLKKKINAPINNKQMPWHS